MSRQLRAKRGSQTTKQEQLSKGIDSIRFASKEARKSLSRQNNYWKRTSSDGKKQKSNSENLNNS